MFSPSFHRGKLPLQVVKSQKYFFTARFCFLVFNGFRTRISPDLHSVCTHSEVNLGGLGGSQDPGGGLNICISVLEVAKKTEYVLQKRMFLKIYQIFIRFWIYCYWQLSRRDAECCWSWDFSFEFVLMSNTHKNLNVLKVACKMEYMLSRNICSETDWAVCKHLTNFGCCS